MTEAQIANNTARHEDAAFRILIGENNADLAMTLQMLLDSEPDMHCVDVASSSQAVLRSQEEHSPNAFILDLSLDDGSSLPLIKILRERLPAAVIVVFTGHKNELLSEQCIRTGADAVVVKTGEFEQLTGALRGAARVLRTPAGPPRADG